MIFALHISISPGMFPKSKKKSCREPAVHNTLRFFRGQGPQGPNFQLNSMQVPSGKQSHSDCWNIHILNRKYIDSSQRVHFPASYVNVRLPECFFVRFEKIHRLTFFEKKTRVVCVKYTLNGHVGKCLFQNPLLVTTQHYLFKKLERKKRGKRKR